MIGRCRRNPGRSSSVVSGLLAVSTAAVLLPLAPALAGQHPTDRPGLAPRALALPSAPVNVTVQGGGSQATVLWAPGPSSPEQYPVTGWKVTTYLGGMPGPSCTAPAAATTCVVSGLGGQQFVYFFVTATSDGGSGPSGPAGGALYEVLSDSRLPPAPTAVTARAGARPGQAIVTWKAARPQVDQSAATWHVVTAVAEGVDAPTGQPACSHVRVPARSCVVTGLRPGTSYRFSVVAGSAGGESSARTSSALPIKPWRVAGPVQAIMCSGSELETGRLRTVRPDQVILDCYASSPQYGAALIRRIDQIAWSAWSSTRATGEGLLHWPTAVPCDVGVPASNCGEVEASYPVRIELRNPQPLSISRGVFHFTEVGLYPTGAGPSSCATNCWFVPALIAYQD